jgi:predicted Zn-dependent protease
MKRSCTLRRRFGSTALFLLTALMMTISGCVTNPVTGNKEFSLLTPAQEKELGAQGDQEIVATYGVYDDAALADYVNQMGQKVAANSDAPDYGYTFRVLDSPIINAFALPGGYVYVTRGLLAYLEDDAQLAMVLGHEIGHVTARHAAKQYTNSQLANLGVGLGAVLFEDVRPFLGAIQTGLQLLFLKYSRDDERQADELGVEYATRSGYQASEGAKFFETLNRMQGQQEGGALPTWQSTHPDPAEREQTILTRAEYWHEQLPSVALGGVDPESYIPRLENIVFGTDPRQGFVQSGIFYHPTLRFQFPVPQGWDIANFSAQVQMASSAGDAVIVMTTATGTDPATAATQFVNDAGAQVIESGARTVNGFNAYRVKSNVQVDDGQGGTATLTVLSYFISKDGRLYVFHGYTEQSQFGSYANTIESVFTNFREVTNSAVLNVQPFRVDAFKAPRTDQFSALVQTNSEAGLGVEDLAIMNQVQSSDQIQSGTDLKQVK